MKRTKLAAVLCCIAAVLSYLAALISAFWNHNPGIGISLSCIGAAMLCLGGALLNRLNRETEGEEKE